MQNRSKYNAFKQILNFDFIHFVKMYLNEIYMKNKTSFWCIISMHHNEYIVKSNEKLMNINNKYKKTLKQKCKKQNFSKEKYYFWIVVLYLYLVSKISHFCASKISLNMKWKKDMNKWLKQLSKKTKSLYTKR